MKKRNHQKKIVSSILNFGDNGLNEKTFGDMRKPVKEYRKSWVYKIRTKDFWYEITIYRNGDVKTKKYEKVKR